MATIFNALPGIDVAVSAISSSLAHMWEEAAARGSNAPAADDVKATQVNFVLHLGFNTTATDAAIQFQNTVRFSRRYPCRVVVLCPLPIDDPSSEMRAKIYGECFLGKSKGDVRCCEFVMLSYPFAARQYLESQLSVCLSADLPLYYWVHRFASIQRLHDYQQLLRRSQRILIDSAESGPEVFTFDWPNPAAVRDLAWARLLPIRQSIGQFMSAFEPRKLGEGVKRVTVDCGGDLIAEANVLLGWSKERLSKCGADAAVAYACQAGTRAERLLELTIEYNDRRKFRYAGDLAKGQARFEADFGEGTLAMPASASLLSPDAALGEGMFL